MHNLHTHTYTQNEAHAHIYVVCSHESEEKNNLLSLFQCLMQHIFIKKSQKQGQHLKNF